MDKLQKQHKMQMRELEDIQETELNADRFKYEEIVRPCRARHNEESRILEQALQQENQAALACQHALLVQQGMMQYNPQQAHKHLNEVNQQCQAEMTRRRQGLIAQQNVEISALEQNHKVERDYLIGAHREVRKHMLITQEEKIKKWSLAEEALRAKRDGAMQELIGQYHNAKSGMRSREHQSMSLLYSKHQEAMQQLEQHLQVNHKTAITAQQQQLTMQGVMQYNPNQAQQLLQQTNLHLQTQMAQQIASLKAQQEQEKNDLEQVAKREDVLLEQTYKKVEGRIGSFVKSYWSLICNPV